MEEVLGGEFNEIHIFLTHKFPHFLDGTYDNENEVEHILTSFSLS
jgi:hypothetical protein